MPENWRQKQLFGYSLDVACGGCGRWVREVYADSYEEGMAGRGRCRECVTASPIVMEAMPEPPVVVEGEESEGTVQAEPDSEIPGVVETFAESEEEGEATAEPEPEEEGEPAPEEATAPGGRASWRGAGRGKRTAGARPS